MGLERSKSDACLFVRTNSEGKVTLVTSCHVDDTLVGGTKEAIAEFKEQLKERFKLKEMGIMKRHLGIRYEWKKDKEGQAYVIATMDDLIKEIIKTTEEHLGREVKPQDTPAKPNQLLELDDSAIINDKMYRAIVGKIMYLTNKLMIEGCNAAREMSKFFMKPQRHHWKAVEHFVGYLKQEQSNIKLTMRKPHELRFMAVADSNYGTDKLQRQSITGGIYTVGGSIIGWTSKAQNHTTLSSTEAEYAAMATTGQELMFVNNILNDMSKAELPSLILGDNEGAISLVKNRQSGARTKHIDIRHHFLRDLWEDGLLRVAHISSEENEADICTKNVTAALHLKLRGRIRDGKLWLNRLFNPPTTQREDVVIYGNEQELI